MNPGDSGDGDKGVVDASTLVQGWGDTAVYSSSSKASTGREILDYIIQRASTTETAVIRWDEETGDVEWSDDVCDILQVDLDICNPTRKAFFNVIHPEDRGEVLETVEQVFDDQIPAHTTFRIMVPGEDGPVATKDRCPENSEILPVQLNVVPVVSEIDGRRGAYLTITLDRVDPGGRNVRVRESDVPSSSVPASILHHSAEYLPVGFFRVELEASEIIEGNNYLAKLLGFEDSSELVGNHTPTFYANHEDHERIVEALRENRVVSIRTTIETIEGEPYEMFISAYRFTGTDGVEYVDGLVICPERTDVVPGPDAVSDTEKLVVERESSAPSALASDPFFDTTEARFVDNFSLLNEWMEEIALDPYVDDVVLEDVGEGELSIKIVAEVVPTSALVRMTSKSSYQNELVSIYEKDSRAVVHVVLDPAFISAPELRSA